MKKALIFETLNEVKTLQTVKEGDDGLMHLKGVFGVCGVKNNNQRIYVKENYKKMVEEMKSRITKSPIPGELEHPQSMNINLENISHKIVDIDINEEGVVSGEIALLNTSKGKQAQAIVEGGLPLFISSRAQGSVDRNGMVTLEMLQTYDLVGSPGFSQAELHLNENQVVESICESCYIITDKDKEEPANATENKDIKDNTDMETVNETIKKLQESIEELGNKINYLEEQNRSLEEQLNEKQDIDLKMLAEGIQDWILKEYSPEVQNWVVEKYSPQIEKWVVEEFTPGIEKWIVEDYSPEVQKWLCEEYSPEVQKWLCEEYSRGIQNWISEHYEAELMSKVDNNIKEGLKASKATRLDMVDTLLKDMEAQVRENKKPVFGRTLNENKNNVNENQENEPRFIQLMPEATRVKWNLASQEVKESIMRRARLYNLNEDAAIAAFWNKVDEDFTNIKGVKSIYEGLDNIMDERERAIRAGFRRHRQF